MDEGYVEMVDMERGLIAVRLRDTSSYCVLQLLGGNGPEPRQRLRFEIHDSGEGILVGDQGETAAVSLLRARCSRDEAQQLLDALP
jgi:hypothetical protein